MSLPRLLFIGVGNMGHPMAARLLAAGYPMLLHDLDRAKADTLLSSGAVWADSIADAAREVNVVITSLPGPAQVRTVMLGSGGVFDSLGPGGIVIDTSTSAMALAHELADAANHRGIGYLEAPITNAIDAAAEGRLSIFVGGSAELYAQCLPIFHVLGNKIFHVGPHGNGSTIKLLTNLLWFVSAAAIGEALMLGAKAGVPLDTVWEAIKSSAGNSWVAEHDVPSIFAGHYDPSFSLELCCKDLRLVNEIAQAQGYELTMGSFVRDLFEKARQTYGEDAAELHVVRLLEDRVGMLLRPPHGEVAA